jgi:hypothetical protein
METLKEKQHRCISDDVKEPGITRSRLESMQWAIGIGFSSFNDKPQATMFH